MATYTGHLGDCGLSFPASLSSAYFSYNLRSRHPMNSETRILLNLMWEIHDRDVRVDLPAPLAVDDSRLD